MAMPIYDPVQFIIWLKRNDHTLIRSGHAARSELSDPPTSADSSECGDMVLRLSSVSGLWPLPIDSNEAALALAVLAGDRQAAAMLADKVLEEYQASTK